MIHKMNGQRCSCGRPHVMPVDRVLIGKGVVKEIAAVVAEYGARHAYVISDKNTYAAAGERVCELLREGRIEYSSYVFPEEHLEPDEHSVGSAVMHYDTRADIIIGVGSGVINDIGKILSKVTGKPYVIVGTAPSMDGFASDSSSMARDGVKISLPSACPKVIIGDTDILRKAPLKMIKAGLGDIIAKYVSICEWRIAHLILDEYYCDGVADIMRNSLKKCAENAAGIMRRDEAAIEAVFEGLVASGVAMSYAGVTRPASGVEHYFSHIWDMRGLAFGTPVELHGLQCAVGTVIAVALYDKLKRISPDRERALAYVSAFDYDKYTDSLRELFGDAAENMIALEKREGKYDKKKHADRLDRIMDNWEEIVRIIDEELPTPEELEILLDSFDSPKTPADVGQSDELIPSIFRATKDLRDKYGISRLAFDLGVIDDLM